MGFSQGQEHLPILFLLLESAMDPSRYSSRVSSLESLPGELSFPNQDPRPCATQQYPPPTAIRAHFVYSSITLPPTRLGASEKAGTVASASVPLAPAEHRTQSIVRPSEISILYIRLNGFHYHTAVNGREFAFKGRVIGLQFFPF